VAVLMLFGCRAGGSSDRAAAREHLQQARAQADAAMAQAQAASRDADRAARAMAAAQRDARSARTDAQVAHARGALRRARASYDRAEALARRAAQGALDAETALEALEGPPGMATTTTPHRAERSLHRAAGEVEQVLPGRITVKTPGGDVALTTDADTRVRLDGQAITPDQLPTGVEADVSYAPKAPLAVARTIDARTRGAAPRAPPHVIRAPAAPPGPGGQPPPAATPAIPNGVR